MEAYHDGKTISNILFIPATNNNGDPGARWLISFTDATSINIFNSSEEIAPFIRINNDGFWNIAYNGTDFEYIFDNNDKKIRALADEPDSMDPYQQEMDLVCISPLTNENHSLFLDIYYASDPSHIIDSVNTGHSVSHDSDLIAVVENDYAGTITFVLNNQESLCFHYKNQWPYSFGILSSEETLFKNPGDSVTIEFFITPSKVDFKLDSDNPLLELKLEYLNGTDAKNYSSYPVTVAEITKALDENNKEIPGRYTLHLEDTGDNLFTYNEPVVLSVCYLGVDRENLSISSEPFYVKYDSESPLIIKSDIPVIKIYSPQSINSKDIWTENCEIQILNARDYNKNYSKVNIKGRGNSTWVLPKKPYAIKLDKKDEMLGFPKHKRWVLLANYYDKTNLRNEIAFFMGRMSARMNEPGLEYTPRSSFARLFLNDKFQGLYQVTEQLKIDEKRVNVGDDGFLLEIDFRATEEAENIYFRIPHIDNYIVIKDPDIENQSDLEYIKDYMIKADNALFSDNFTDPQSGYRKYIDVNSFVDWYLVNEITKNADANFWSSCYMNLSRGGKLKMGPIWDFDLAAGNYQDFGDWWYTQWLNNPQDFHIKNVQWFERLFEDPYFVNLLKQRFMFYYERQNEIFEELETQKKLIYDVIEENEKIWFCFSKPYSYESSYQAFNANCDELKNWLSQRFTWLKRNFDNL